MNIFCAVAFIFALITICKAAPPAECTHGEYYHNLDDCTTYYHCVHGSPVHMSCPTGLVFSTIVNVCVYPGSEEDDCTTQVASEPCPDGWRRYIDFCYIYQSEKVSWSAAKDKCAALGGALAEPDTACRDSVLVGLAKDAGDNESFGPWIGGYKEAEQWKWDSSGEAVTYTKWGPDEPNNATGNENCMHYNWLSWNDLRCEYAASYLCQKPVAV